MKLSKAVLAVVLSATLSPAIGHARSQTHPVVSSGHPRNPFLWLFRHRVDQAPKHKR